MKKLFLFCILSTIALTACVSAQVTTLAPSTYPPVTPEQVRIYLTQEDVKGEFEKIALIHLKGDTSFTNESQMIAAAQKKAAEAGANGIILGKIVEPSSGAKIAAAIFKQSVKRRGEVVAVYVKPGTE